ncbi:hypothetical protein CEXT_273841 [Caerostris extrusa]|uniref:Uncharacterized protein n=1 Tax=Caerostris extrusa TaxID=172846 RepID=A0AAV4NRJ6_CAEEX|nr:hypothetical protein CEXT_273841 [Caerostris extrusa]
MLRPGRRLLGKRRALRARNRREGNVIVEKASFLLFPPPYHQRSFGLNCSIFAIAEWTRKVSFSLLDTIAAIQSRGCALIK